MTDGYTLQLTEPAYLEVSTPPSYQPAKVVKIDIYEARRFLFDEAPKEPNEALRWKKVKEWLAAKLGVSGEVVAESSALLVHNAIARIVDEKNKELQLKIAGIVSSQQPTQASPATTLPGQEN